MGESAALAKTMGLQLETDFHQGKDDVLRTLGDSISAWASVSPFRSALVRNATTVIVMVSVIALCTLSPFQHNAWIIVMVAILACSWFGGVGPSLVAPLLLIMSVRIVQKEWGQVFDFSTKELSDLVVFLLLTVAVGWSGEVRRRAQRLARDQARQLREEARRKDHFLATLAHELRNPLAPLRSGLELLHMTSHEAADKSLVRDVREMMKRQVDQLVRLIDDLLDVSRINTGKFELRRERVDLVRTIRDAVDCAQPHMQAANHRLDLAIADSDLVIDADPARISQVVLNILNNAAKFTPAGGHIQLTAARAGDMAEIRVSDNGVGIPPEMLPRVFDMFTQVDGTLTRSRGGLGIGLGIVRTLVRMHGGTVAVHSDGPGRGSLFLVRLPLSSSDAAQREECQPSAAAENGAARQCRILVVDDNEDAARSLALLLNVKGHLCHLAFSGPTALRAVAEFQPEAVVLDIGMPEMNGYEVVQRLRALPQGERLVVIAVTGWGQESDRRRSAAAGFDHHLVKPVNIDVLEELLTTRGRTVSAGPMLADRTTDREAV